MIEIADIVKTYRSLGSIRATAKELGVSYQITRKALVTAGIIVTDRTKQIMDLYRNGMSVSEIATYLHCSENTVHTHIPYTRCTYTIGEKTPNAIKIQEWRKSKNQNHEER